MAKTKTVNFDRTIEAMAQGESNNWAISRALVDELIPAGPRQEIPKSAYADLAAAQAAAGLEVWDYAKARNYRRTAEIFGAADVVAGLSWGAHYAAMNAGSLPAALNAIRAVGNTIDHNDPIAPATMRQVTVAKVRAHVRTLAGSGKAKGKAKRQKSGKVGTLSIAAVAVLANKVRNVSTFVTPLVKDGRMADLKRDLAAGQAWVDWLGEAIDKAEAKVTAPANVSRPKATTAATATQVAGSRPKARRGN